ncbi:GFA family protein [Burkholderia sp. Ax-1719]|nr:GFA family protein [Burkholderia sp. Ax-1719]
MEGSCLCQAVQYVVEDFASEVWDCMCKTCRKTHSAHHNTAARILREHFKLISGQQNLRTYESSPGKLRHFCGTCGSHVYAERPELPFVVLRVATLDVDPGLRPVMRAWTSHQVAWLETDASAATYEGHPPL